MIRLRSAWRIDCWKQTAANLGTKMDYDAQLKLQSYLDGELPEDPARATSRDPHSGFIAYVPRGSIAKGEALVKTGGSGKTIQCAICHGESLEGLGELPRIIGISPLYAARQLYGFQAGTRNGSLDVLMKKVVANLNGDDIVAISAYLASRNP